ncbi:MAG: hypothetical protein QOF42_2253 [Gammaproteobacteria bacterium]|nr:hypothetical protein [Gammaproteobacteria bacterium]
MQTDLGQKQADPDHAARLAVLGFRPRGLVLPREMRIIAHAPNIMVSNFTHHDGVLVGQPLWTTGLICPSRCFCCDEMTGVLRMPEQKPIKVESGPGEPKVLKTPTGVRGVDIYQFPWVRDPRGDLTVGQFESEFPFLPKRYFIISGVPSDQIRGEHAHKQCHQFLICAYGQCSVTVDDGTTCLEVLLDKPSVGIYLPPMIWGKQWQYSADAALLVFASEPYDPSDYIREYEAFVKAARAPE